MPTALIVDDNSENRYLLERLFLASGYRVSSATNGREALDVAEQNPPDLVLSDILMPVMDGFSLCRHWKQSKRLKAIPFVFYTATYTEPRDEQFALSLGADLFVVKPAEPDELMRLVQEVLNRRSSGQLRLDEDSHTEEAPYLREYNEVLIRKLEDKLAELEKANQGLRIKEFAIASAHAGIAMADLSGNFTYFNAAFAELWGIIPSAVQTHDLSLVLPAESKRQRVLGQVHANRHWAGQVQRHTLEGPIRLARVEIHVVSGPDGAPLCLMVTCSDVTEQERLREELQRRQRLESLSQFAAGIAHDFNNLLTVMFNGLNLTQADETALDSKLPQSYVLTAFTRAKDLTQRLLNFGKNGNQQRRTIALRALVEECCEMALSGSGTTCSIDLNSELWTVHANATELSQVFCNLIINARQAMRDGGSLQITAENCTLAKGDILDLHAGHYVRLHFRDTGPGIAPEAITRVFEPYFTSKPEGTGLGLAMSQAIITNHGGRIIVDSKPGDGATFDVLLPAKPNTAESVMPVAEQAKVSGSGRILWMDDEPSICKLTSMMLSKAGYDVTTASKGEEAIELYNQARSSGKPFDLVVLDLTVKGGLGGYETLARLLELDPDVVAFACSGYSDDATSVSIAEAGFRGLIAKPYLAHELYAVVQAAIEKRRSSGV